MQEKTRIDCQLICMWGIAVDASAGARGSKAALNKAAASLTKASVCALRTRSNVVEWQNTMPRTQSKLPNPFVYANMPHISAKGSRITNL